MLLDNVPPLVDRFTGWQLCRCCHAELCCGACDVCKVCGRVAADQSLSKDLKWKFQDNSSQHMTVILNLVSTMQCVHRCTSCIYDGTVSHLKCSSMIAASTLMRDDYVVSSVGAAVPMSS